MGDEVEVIETGGRRFLRQPGEQFFQRDWGYISESPEKDQLFLAVHRNAMRDFKILTKCRSPNRTNYCGKSLLEHVISHRRFEMFDYLMTLDNLEVDFLDNSGKTPLIFAVQQSRNCEYFALELIKKGANIHLTDKKGATALHNIVQAPFIADRMQVGQLIIEKGADVNAQDNNGETPLYKACNAGSVDWIYLLLYHGALATIPSYQGVLPLAILCIRIPQEERMQLEDILFDYTFDARIDSVQLATLVKTMSLDSTLFTRIVEGTPEVRYDIHALEQLSNSLTCIQSTCFKLFVDKYGNIVKEMFKNCRSYLMKHFAVDPTRNVQEILQFIFESDHVFDFTQTLSSSDYTIGKLISDILSRHRIYEIKIRDDEMFKIVYILLTYGCDVNSNDLDIVYTHYGYCDLFKILLHMDIQMADNKKDKCVMARLYYNLSTKIDDFCNESSVSVKLLCYYNHPKLKEVCLKKSDDEVVAKANTLPTLPYLAELSRDAARHYIISRYDVKNSMHFYTVLKGLPIGNITKEIIALEKELYLLE